jgi:hypothetical protein
MNFIANKFPPKHAAMGGVRSKHKILTFVEYLDNLIIEELVKVDLPDY